MSNTNEYLQRIYAAIGGNINDLPDNLKSTIYTAIILKCGGTVDDLPDGLETTYLKRILELVQGGGGDSVDFWDIYQNYGNRFNYEYGFAGKGWNDQTFKPKYDIILNGTYTGTAMFLASDIVDLRGILESRGIIFDTRNNCCFAQFMQNALIEIAPTIDMSNEAAGCSYAFASANIKSIQKLIFSDKTVFKAGTTAFQGATNLEDVIFDGVIPMNGLNLQWSTKLSKESLLSLLNCLKDYSQDTSGTVWQVTIGSENKAKLTESELEIAWNKGWEVL